jgi:hypothetical protein
MEKMLRLSAHQDDRLIRLILTVTDHDKEIKTAEFETIEDNIAKAIKDSGFHYGEVSTKHYGR